ncbi:MAG: hypothetical protein KKD11_04860 [Candidatus Omnitrophica bacterium]|nr:hypothetical protein [Candidatus Omnitrophota bacterium]
MKGIKSLIIVTLITIIGVFYLSSIREGHSWGGDFSAYIHHAKNIVEGVDYKDTSYIYNPSCSSVGPETYSPVFPLLLSPVYKSYGLDLTSMKMEIILIFLLFLLILFFIFRNELSFQYLVAMIALVGFNPYLWSFKDNVVSDIPFLLFLYLGLLFIHKVRRSYESKSLLFLDGILIGLFSYLSYGTRGIGIILIFLLLYDVVRFKKPIKVAIIAVSVFLFFAIPQTVFLHSNADYFKEFISIVNGRIIIYNLFSYIHRLSLLWDNSYIIIFRYALFAITSILAIIGYTLRIKQKVTIFEIFSILYVVPVIMWPGHGGIRYLFPVVPFYLFYAFLGIRKLSFHGRKIERPVFIILIAVIFLSYISKYTKIDYGPIKSGVAKKESVQLFNYIKDNTEKEAVFIFQKPRVLALYTGRKASAYHCPRDYKELWDYLSGINANYIILARPLYKGVDKDGSYIRLFLEKYKESFQEVYSNPDFKVYQIKSAHKS